MTDPLGRWAAFRTPREAPLRLLCFHHATGDAATYRHWAARAGDRFDVVPVQLPGRATRLSEPAFRDVRGAAAAAVRALLPLLDRPYVLFGHSLGAAVAYEFAHQARAIGLDQPLVLGVSARRSAKSAPRIELFGLPEDAFVQRLLDFNGTPPELLEHPEMRKVILDISRADFEANDTYRAGGRPLDATIVAMGGIDDCWVAADDLADWADLTRGRFRMAVFPGGHFYLNDVQDRILDLLHGEAVAALERTVPA